MLIERIARRYAVALLDLTLADENKENISKNLDLISKTISESHELKMVLRSPIVSRDKKKKILEEIFSSKIEKVTLKYITGIVDSERADLIEEILKTFSELQDEANNILRVEVKTAIEISKEEENSIVIKLENLTKKKIKPTFKIDEKIKGGFVVKIGDMVLDSSISHKLEKLRESFLNAEFSRN